jgi:hypothetical protein
MTTITIQNAHPNTEQGTEQQEIVLKVPEHAGNRTALVDALALALIVIARQRRQHCSTPDKE